MNSDGTSYEKLEPQIQAAMPNEVYFLDGGFNGYRKFWKEQAAIWAAAAHPPKKPRCGA